MFLALALLHLVFLLGVPFMLWIQFDLLCCLTDLQDLDLWEWLGGALVALDGAFLFFVWTDVLKITALPWVRGRP